MRNFEFHAYRATGTSGEIASKPEVTTKEFAETAQAKGFGGRLAKKVNGPVDIAFAYQAGEIAQDWDHRYITTAAPSEHHASGYRFERLDG